VKTVSCKVVRHLLACLTMYKWLVGDVPLNVICTKCTTHLLDSVLEIPCMPYLYCNDDNAVRTLQQWQLTNVTPVFGCIAQS